MTAVVQFFSDVQRGRVMVIDFDQAVLRPAPKHRQVSAVRTKRKHGADRFEGCSRKRGLLYKRLQPAVVAFCSVTLP